MTTALVLVGAYLLGSVPFGYWVVRVAKGEDIRASGSGSIGASNVWRTYGKGYGIPIVLLDIGKGFAPALVGTLLEGELVGVLAGGAAMLGHWRPLFLGFQKGGKMVATAAGTFLGVVPLFGLLSAGVWLLLFVVTRYTSVASIVTGIVLPILALFLGESWPVVAFAVLAGAFVVYLHRPNLAR
nr:glycerol-3-phosphate 1-O-acyltransferase PlsY [Actinomycetota bacterium]